MFEMFSQRQRKSVSEKGGLTIFFNSASSDVAADVYARTVQRFPVATGKTAATFITTLKV